MMRFSAFALALLLPAAAAAQVTNPGMSRTGANALAPALAAIAAAATGCNDVNKFVTGTGTCVTLSAGGAMLANASNAVLPDALNNLGLGTASTPQFGQLAVGGAIVAATPLSIYGGGNQIGLRMLNNAGQTALFGYSGDAGGAGLYGYAYTGGQGPPFAVGYRGTCASGSPGTLGGHFAFRTLDDASAEDTVAATYGYVLDCTHAAMHSRLQFGWMNAVNATGGNAQPNQFFYVDRNGMVLPGIPLGGITNLSVNTSAIVGSESTEGEAALSTPAKINLQTSGQDNLILTNGGAGGLSSSLAFRGTSTNFGSNYSTGHLASGRTGALASGYATGYLAIGSASANNAYNDEITVSNNTTTIKGLISTSAALTTPILTGYAVASLPAGTIGMLAYVTDQITACPVPGVAPTAGGSFKCPVFYNGSAWVGM